MATQESRDPSKQYVQSVIKSQTQTKTEPVRLMSSPTSFSNSSSPSSIDYSQYVSREPEVNDFSQAVSREPEVQRPRQIDYSQYVSREPEGNNFSQAVSREPMTSSWDSYVSDINRPINFDIGSSKPDVQPVTTSWSGYVGSVQQPGATDFETRKKILTFQDVKSYNRPSFEEFPKDKAEIGATLITTPSRVTRGLALEEAYYQSPFASTGTEQKGYIINFLTNKGIIKPGEVLTDKKLLETYAKERQDIIDTQRVFSEEAEKRQKALPDIDIIKESKDWKEDWKTFQDKYSEYYDQETNIYYGLPKQGSEELSKLKIRGEVLQDRAKPFIEYSEFVQSQEKVPEIVKDIEEMSMQLSERELKKINESSDLLSSGQLANALQVKEQEEKKFKAEQMLGQFNFAPDSKIYGKTYEEVYTQGERFVPFLDYNPYTLNPKQQWENLVTGFSNIKKTAKFWSQKYSGASATMEEKYGEKPLGLVDVERWDKLWNVLGDKQTEFGLSVLNKLEEKDAPESVLRIGGAILTAQEKTSKQIGGVPKVISRNPVESIYTGAFYLTPIGPALTAGTASIPILAEIITAGEAAGTTLAPFSGTKQALEMGEDEVQRRIRLGLGEEERELFPQEEKGIVQNIKMGVREWIPGYGKLIFSDPQAFVRGAVGVEKGEVITESQYALQQYFGTRSLGGRVGEGVALIAAEVPAELLGRSFTQSFRTTTARKAIEQGKAGAAFRTGFKETFGPISLAAPAEVVASYTTSKLGSYEEPNPIDIPLTSLWASPLAGTVGGVVSGGALATRAVMPKTTKIGRIGKVTEVGAKLIDLPEEPGDRLADFFEKLSGTASKQRTSRIRTLDFGFTTEVQDLPTIERQQLNVNLATNELPTTAQDFLQIEEFEEEPGIKKRQSFVSENIPTQIEEQVSENVIENIYSDVVISESIPASIEEPVSIDIPQQQPTLINEKIFENFIVQIPEQIQVPAEVPTEVPTEIPAEVQVEVPIIEFKPEVPLIPPVFPFPEGRAGKTKGKVGKKKTGYQPGFVAIVLGITATKAPTQKTFTGQEIRPIISPQKGKKQDIPFAIFNRSNNKNNNINPIFSGKW